ncbi:heterokaryon incompatibility protein-domain-containing protein [Cadophora sp. MPI-SDFR-AT-0126]|nr:heterokaryon incompatibility protein-domain-containing protein [Leotiomycetes sp. MPI-SDFR-AT-0126]
MRLINTKSLQLHDFSLAEIPPYAILSHTWGDSEVTFQDLSLPQSQRVVKKGYVKVEKTCELALKDGLGFAWIDTCCIDKSSSAELTESINSMFQWYKAAELCYIALEDLEPGTTYEAGFPKCRWFTRGWTLQELLAPRTVEFYDMGWNHRGSRLDFTSTIARITSIPTSLLRGDSDVADYSVAERMSWAACRQTTRVEDVGYCLLGIFDVNMPLIYGEGTKAFRRLQEEIVKRNNDLTIFAWESPSQQSSHFSLFAHSPEAFADSAGIVFLDLASPFKGLLL